MADFILAATPLAVIAQFLFAAWLAPRTSQSRGPASAVLTSSYVALGTAGLAAVALTSIGGLPIVDSLGWFRIDALSATMLLLITFLGVVILRFSRNYLDGDPERNPFLSRLCVALAAVVALVTAENIAVLIIGWVATSLVVHRLLLHFPDRPRAQVAARKKFFFARTGDVLLIIAGLLMASAFGTLSISTILEVAKATPDLAARADVTLACFCLAGAAMLKCAQFPTHGWLTEVMETPTPVSALLHAGIVNAGGFILIRFSDVIVLSPGAMTALVIIGAFSAVFGAVVMLTQTSVKGSLAHSTIAQMGLMLFQCGLGAFSAAALHLVAHSLYKAHAFLSSGRAVGSIAARKPSLQPNALGVGIGLVGVLALYLGVGALFADSVTKSAGVVALGAIFATGLFVYVVSVARIPGAFAIAIGVSLVGSFSYFTLQVAASTLLTGLVPVEPALGAWSAFVVGVAVAFFVAIALVQAGIIRSTDELAQRAYVHLSRGLYANALNDRLNSSLRLRHSNKA
ncbi:MAG: proton-conducting transporter membrane subunit [Pseudomonadota bacterium]